MTSLLTCSVLRQRAKERCEDTETHQRKETWESHWFQHCWWSPRHHLPRESLGPWEPTRMIRWMVSQCPSTCQKESHDQYNWSDYHMERTRNKCWESCWHLRQLPMQQTHKQEGIRKVTSCPSFLKQRALADSPRWLWRSMGNPLSQQWNWTNCFVRNSYSWDGWRRYKLVWSCLNYNWIIHCHSQSLRSAMAKSLPMSFGMCARQWQQINGHQISGIATKLWNQTKTNNSKESTGKHDRGMHFWNVWGATSSHNFWNQLERRHQYPHPGLRICIASYNSCSWTLFSSAIGLRIWSHLSSESGHWLGMKESSSSVTGNSEQCQQKLKARESHVQSWRQGTHCPQEVRTAKESKDFALNSCARTFHHPQIFNNGTVWLQCGSYTDVVNIRHITPYHSKWYWYDRHTYWNCSQFKSAWGSISYAHFHVLLCFIYLKP